MACSRVDFTFTFTFMFMFYMHRYRQYSRQNSVFNTVLPTVLMYVKDINKLKYKFRKCAFLWFIQGVTEGTDQTSGECSLC